MSEPRFKVGDMVVLKTNVALIHKIPDDMQWLTNRGACVGQVNIMREDTCSAGMQRYYQCRFYSHSGTWMEHFYHEHELDPFVKPEEAPTA